MAAKLLEYDTFIKRNIIPSIDKEVQRFNCTLHLPIEYIIQQYKKSRDKKTKDVLYLMCKWEYSCDKWQCTLRGWKPNQYGVVMVKHGINYLTLVKYAHSFNLKRFNMKRGATVLAKHMESLYNGPIDGQTFRVC